MPIKTILVVLACAGAVAAGQDSAAPLTLVTTIPMETVKGRIDHMAADVAGQRLFVAALGNNTVEILDLGAGKHIRSLAGFSEPQGIAFVPAFNRLFIANGQNGTCCVLDGTSFKTIRTLQCGDDADNVRYDEPAKRIYVGYGNGALAVLDAGTGDKQADIRLAAHPESFQIETGGSRIFVNVPHADQMAAVDRNTAQVIGTWPVKEARANFPMSLDQANHRLFTGCRNPPRVLVYDISSSAARVLGSVAIGHDTDDLFYDRSNNLLYVSCGEGVLDVLRQQSPDNYVLLSSIPTAAGARTSLFIPELKFFCLAVPRREGHLAEVRVFKTP